jgi:hypothetical protein
MEVEVDYKFDKLKRIVAEQNKNEEKNNENQKLSRDWNASDFIGKCTVVNSELPI